jgi:hypothetical protein
MFTQITAIATPMPAPTTNIRFLLCMDPLMRIMLRLRRARMLAEPALVLALASMRSLVVLQLLLGAEGATAGNGCASVDVRAGIGVVAGMSSGDVPIEFSAVFERRVAGDPVAGEGLGAEFAGMCFLEVGV